MNWFGVNLMPMRHPYNCCWNDPVYMDHSWFAVLRRSLKRMIKKILLLKNTDEIRTTERTIEIPLAIRFVQEAVSDQPLLELGCVTPYYIFKNLNHTVYDLMDPHYQCEKVDIRDLTDEDFKTNVLAISTLEHVGLSDYGIAVDNRSAIDTLRKIVRNAKLYLITIPLGINEKLDDYLLSKTSELPQLYFATCLKNESQDWRLINESELTDDMRKFGGWMCANTICIITNFTR